MNRTQLTTTIISAIIFLLVTTGAIAQSGTDGPISWTLDGNGKLTVSSTGVVNRDSYENLKPSWLPFIESIREVVISQGMDIIWEGAFAGCKNLQKVTLPNTLKSIGKRSFYDCSNLQAVFIPASVTLIDDEAFRGCSGLTYATISNSVTQIGFGAFYECKGLTSIIIPNSVTEIGARAFFKCSGLSALAIPNSVRKIGESAFFDCTGLTSITISNALTEIEAGVFFGCSNVTSVVIPNSVKVIGVNAFAYCTKLSTVALGASVTTIKRSAFGMCDALTFLSIPASVTEIDYCAFIACYNLTTIEVHWLNPIRIPESLFNGKSMSHLIILRKNDPRLEEGPQVPIHMGDLTLIVPKGRKEAYKSNSYWGTFGQIVENGETYSPPITTYREGSLTWSFYATVLTISGTGDMQNYLPPTRGRTPWADKRKNIRKIVLSEGVTSIGAWAFADCEELIAVSIPNSVKKINEFAFSVCRKLKSVALNDGLTSIGNNAFYRCVIDTITIPCSVTELGYSVFTEVKAIEVGWEHPLPLKQMLVNGQPDLIVPLGTMRLYRNVDYWGAFKTIKESNRRGCAPVDLRQGQATTKTTTTEPVQPNENAVPNITVDKLHEIQTLNFGLAAYYTFDNNNAHDASGNELHASLIENPAFTGETSSGKGKALVLNGNRKQYMNIPYTPLKGKNRYSISLWVKGFSEGVLFAAVARDYYERSDYPRLRVRPDGKFTFFTGYDNNNYTAPFSYSFSPLLDGRWHNITVICKPAQGMERCIQELYINGVLTDRSEGHCGEQTNGIERTKMQIGGSLDGKLKSFTSMTVDNIRIYDRALDAQEVKAIYNLEK